jgi:uncharacterized protein YggE
MWNSQNQTITTPFGITVFGSALSRVAPDIALIKVSVTRLEPKPADAFAKARQGSQAVQDWLRKARINQFGASRVTLLAQNRFSGGENKFVGYQANVSFHVTLAELDRMEEVLTALIASGANQVDGVSFETTRLKEVRAEARKRAVTAARAKATNYCAAAGVELGPVMHIEDVNPMMLQGREGHVRAEPQIDDEGDGRALDPGSISVGAAVFVAYGIRADINSP